MSRNPWDTRFRARARINRALFLAVPFFNMLLLAAAFGLFSMAYAKRPGVVVQCTKTNPRARRDRPAEVFARRRYDVVSYGRAKVYDKRRAVGI